MLMRADDLNPQSIIATLSKFAQAKEEKQSSQRVSAITHIKALWPTLSCESRVALILVQSSVRSSIKVVDQGSRVNQSPERAVRSPAGPQRQPSWSLTVNRRLVAVATLEGRLSRHGGLEGREVISAGGSDEGQECPAYPRVRRGLKQAKGGAVEAGDLCAFSNAQEHYVETMNEEQAEQESRYLTEKMTIFHDVVENTRVSLRRQEDELYVTAAGSSTKSVTTTRTNSSRRTKERLAELKVEKDLLSRKMDVEFQAELLRLELETRKAMAVDQLHDEEELSPSQRSPCHDRSRQHRRYSRYNRYSHRCSSRSQFSRCSQRYSRRSHSTTDTQRNENNCQNFNKFANWYKKDPVAHWQRGSVVQVADTPKSYVVQDDSGARYQRNSRHVRSATVPTDSEDPSDATPQVEPDRSKDVPRTFTETGDVITRSGRRIPNNKVLPGVTFASFVK
ncbi:hypothetical protein CAPTEDRAFT_203051 [Capitella teleta]|uniref:Uncharacterized protein n=1 Tax=Capitella teleta TaxID=283909 RepID=R7TRZ7_CAPTE|nr:hypothetical protein CAPTEDRAFT_203051 [Capitella teleta]|eukprot:ELT96414.1 hypothetical protein CAPTEDRAFT_203051 [Capitella teleta]